MSFWFFLALFLINAGLAVYNTEMANYGVAVLNGLTSIMCITLIDK